MASTRGRGWARTGRAGLPAPHTTDSYLRVSDPRRGEAEVLCEERGGAGRSWVVGLPGPVRYGGGRRECRCVCVLRSEGPDGPRTMALPSTPRGYARSWEVLAESRLEDPAGAMRECVRLLGWEVAR